MAAELSRRGYIATITNKNTEGIDVLATRLDAQARGRTLKIQVKTIQGARSKWVMNAKAEDMHSPDLYYIFVRLVAVDQRPLFHIVPSQVVATQIADHHRQWLKGAKKSGEARKDTDMRDFRDAGNAYLDAWHLLERNPSA